ncbi:MAG: zinc-dependent metalloprotease [Acidobacteriota bacterium]|nr:zinc-dependent metalloprotease [Blastocatellia bacterium]MDW8413471.1 zinc-dependent metalloprotease [Acidobacteriota bacterium]
MHFLAFLLITIFTVTQEADQKQRKPSDLKKYSEVVTEKAKTAKGLFSVHRIDEKVYYEIPQSLLGRDMLWNSEVAKLPVGVGYGGLQLGYRVVRWERKGLKVYLRDVSYDKRAKEDEAIKLAVEASSFAPIIMAFDVETENAEKDPVINVTKLLTSDVPEFSAQRALWELGVTAAPAVDTSRCFVDEVKVFPTNIEVRSTITYNLGVPQPPSRNPATPTPQYPNNIRSISALVHYSLVLLPEKPMMGRYADSRVGFFTEDFEDYDNSENRVVPRSFITRYRLEKKDPQATISEPIKPIVYYISREVPEKWHVYIKRGVEAWNEAFEAAGFKNAIVCRKAPSPEEDPNWDPEDARYSVIRWVARNVQNAQGPHVHDPRSGQIISAHIILWHDILKLQQGWYFVQCGAVDPRASKLPLPESLVGELLQYVVSHEVGHTLGLRHNHKASSAYTVAQLRDPEFTAKYGTVASIMAYGRFNYVAQPKDGVTQLLPKIGPYDKFAIEWGYRQLGASSPEAEKPLLDKIAARQIENKWLEFGGEDGPAFVDPSVKRENISDDPIEATELGLKNMDRLAELLVPATDRLGEDYTLLREMYDYIILHRRSWLDSVVRLVGGVVERRTLGGRSEVQFTRVPKETQKRAVEFLLKHAFSKTDKLLASQIIDRFKYIGVADQLLTMQQGLLQSLLSPLRFRLLADAELMDGKTAYTQAELLNTVQDGLWSELAAANPQIDIYRRNLQRFYLEHIRTQLQQPTAAVSPASTGTPIAASPADKLTDFRALARAALTSLSKKLQRAALRTTDQATLAHINDCRKEIELILKGEDEKATARALPPAATSTPAERFCAWER